LSERKQSIEGAAQQAAAPDVSVPEPARFYRVTTIDILGTYRLRVSFDDGSIREIDLEQLV